MTGAPGQGSPRRRIGGQAAAIARMRTRIAAACPVLGLLLACAAALPPLATVLEASMTRHMLLQYPLLLAGGALAAGGLSAGARAAIARWNALGIAGLVVCALVLTLGMIPRVLDLALADARMDAIKAASLVLAGAALRCSWRPAGRIVQGFFLGNVLPMTAIAGLLIQDAPLRVCNAYRLDEQQSLGTLLVWAAALAGLAWLARVAWELGRDAPHQRAATPTVTVRGAP